MAAAADAAVGITMIEKGAVAIEGDRIVDIGLAVDLAARHMSSERVQFPDAVLVPGFVNAHQHGRGLSQIQLGYPDDQLEPWIARRRGRGAPDAYALTRLAAEEMLANGVTATIHANYSYASGNYEAELRASIRAYLETGLRATVCVGYADRGGLVYPPADESVFRAGLSAAAQALLQSARPAWLPLEGTLDLMARLCEEFAGHPTITLAYGPAGPQWVSDAAWRSLAEDAARRGLGLHFHLLESPAQAACAKVLYPEGVLNRLQSLGVFEARASAAHFAQATERDIADAARMGLVIVSNPGSNMRLGNGPPDIARWRAAGLDVALGTDNCAFQDNEDYLSELRLGSLLARGNAAAGKSDGAATFLMGTDAGARAMFVTDAGRLTLGMKADLVALDLSRLRGTYLDQDTDLLGAVIARGLGSDVLMTVVDGVERYRRGRLADLRRNQAAELAAKAAAASRSVGEDGSFAAAEIAEALRSHYVRLAQ
ncbi:amidohydrolase family protein [Rhizobium sp. YS-1r]|uniref:amidohydrolase family protein n=1 Tax=Rhizobium sp. YS-1r TaxID=1532558 RepID=UPI00190F3614|nr:amidohydrolase family protein [Rhizobium sp. YS-1r]